jgi:transcriptional regulator with XRE-family HTH domain
MDAQELTARREALGLSRPALAREVGVAESTLWRWEQGKGISGLALRQLEQTLRRLERAPRRPRGGGDSDG